jgi:serine protease Do
MNEGTTLDNKHMKRTIGNYLHKARLALIAAALLGVSAEFAFQNVRATDKKQAEVHVHVDSTPVNRDAKSGNSFAPVVKKVSPSVVRINITGKVRADVQTESPMDDPMLRRFFGDQFGGPGMRQKLRPQREHGLGSGVIVSHDGYILTNNHVVENADKVQVVLEDGREFDAKVVGTDPKSDVAVVKVEANDLPYVAFADSDSIEVGDTVLAIGNPFGVGTTVTSGIVSATGRATLGLDYEDFIQTDAAINPGNSGGALIDAQGRLVGINTAILSRSGGNNGIGFAIPSNLARNVMDQIVTTGHVTRGFLGVNIQTVTPSIAKKFDLKDAKGALVADVTPKSPADKAGIQSGDIILEYNGKPVLDSRHLKLAVGATAPGTEVPVKVSRDGKIKELKVALKELPGDDKLAKNDHSATGDDDALNGVGVADLNSNYRKQFDIPSHVKGAIVTEVDQDSASYQAGLREGDVVLEIDRKPVANAEDAVEMSKHIKNKSSILLKVWSKGGTRFLVVDESQVG